MNRRCQSFQRKHSYWITQMNVLGALLTIDLTWQTQALLGVKELFIRSRTFLRNLLFKSEFEYFGLGVMCVLRKTEGMSPNCNGTSLFDNFTEGILHLQMDTMHVLEAGINHRLSILMLVSALRSHWPRSHESARRGLRFYCCFTGLRTDSDNEQSNPRGTISFLMCLIW